MQGISNLYFFICRVIEAEISDENPYAGTHLSSRELYCNNCYIIGKFMRFTLVRLEYRCRQKSCGWVAMMTADRSFVVQWIAKLTKQPRYATVFDPCWQKLSRHSTLHSTRRQKSSRHCVGFVEHWVTSLGRYVCRIAEQCFKLKLSTQTTDEGKLTVANY